MTVNSVRSALLAVPVSALLLVSACGTTGGDNSPVYKSAGTRAPLDIPPDLVSPTSNDRFGIPGAGGSNATTLSEYEKARGIKSTQKAGLSPGFSTVSLERAGQLRWLKVARPPADVWGQVREFWQDNGFLINVESQETGVMETDWAEKTAKVSSGLIRDSLSRVFGTRYSSSERDAFRARLEAVEGGTEVYISHRGMEEVISQELRDGNAVWQPRPSDHELEIEFLRRLMNHLGSSEQDSIAAVGRAKEAVESLSEIIEQQGASVLQIREEFDRAWRRVGLALDRGSFTIEDRNRAKGIYFVRYIDSDKTKKKPGAFARLFGAGDDEKDPRDYQIQVAGSGDTASVTVKAGKGGEEPAPAETARRMLSLIQEKLGQ